MIRFGEGWTLEHGTLVHACRPGRRFLLIGSHCECGAHVPRRVRLFWAWLSTNRGAMSSRRLEASSDDEGPFGR
jgi:hypothetical protein